ncbi:hypothetical protein NCAS_0A09790 [Naumovozyma castellii]|uniref:Phospholipase C/D domain-containing protein n=1 Tax=Naumovozyma castellii TaxID=27288 RepID=G0V7T9_NAUCA|nr:hypothetical protein NCAS_0A09790 [Naumovozyma castellii CBS 4309]CCC67537.1 hypothetical protein NCAS_0A09790 [Naumovozyma castellii CBS 4309]
MNSFDYAALICFFVAIFYHNVNAAGVITHLTFLSRCAPDELQELYYPWLKAGSFFPDSLYHCDPNNEKWAEFAEFTHWPKFIEIGIQYWHEKYQQVPESDDAIKLKSFILGVFSHQLVDISWHSLISNMRTHGLLKAFSELEFNGDISEAHNYLDVFGEFILLSNILGPQNHVNNERWEFYTDKNWVLPIEEDMLEYIARSGFSDAKISYKNLKTCLATGITAANTELSTFRSNRNNLLGIAYRISPRAKEFLQEYWLGGEFDLISQLRNCIPVIQSHFNQEAYPLNVLQCYDYLPCLDQEIQTPRHEILNLRHMGNSISLTPNVPFSNFGSTFTIGRFKDDDKYYLAISAPLQERVYLVKWAELGPSIHDCTEMISVPSIHGSKVDTLTLNDTDFLVVSNPKKNKICFYRHTQMIICLEDTLTQEVHQLKVETIHNSNNVSESNIFISSTYFGSEETGKLYILPSLKLLPLIFKEPVLTPIEITSLPIVQVHPGSQIVPYQHFGSSVESTDLCLYVTSQNQGVVFIYSIDAQTSQLFPKYYIQDNRNINPINNSNLPNLPLKTSNKHGMFGYLMKSWCHEGDIFVAISQHLFNKIHIYREVKDSIEFYCTLEFNSNVEPISSMVGFGTAIEYRLSDRTLYISSPGIYGGIGAIWKVSMREIRENRETMKKSSLNLNKFKYLHAINSKSHQRGISSFGSTLLSTFDNRLIIGIPNDGYGELKQDQLTGSIQII